MAVEMLENRRFNVKEQKDKCVYRSLVHKIEQASDWRVFSVQLPCLSDCNYGNGSEEERGLVALGKTLGPVDDPWRNLRIPIRSQLYHSHMTH